MKFTSLVISTLFLCAAASRIKIASFTPETNAVYSTESVPAGKSLLAQNPKDTAIAFAKTKYGLKDSQFRVSSFYKSSSNGVTHVYLKQLYRGTEVSNGNINISIDEKNNIISYGSSFAVKDSVTESQLSKTATPLQAVKVLAKHLGLSDNFQAKEEVTEGLLPGNKLYTFSGVPNTLRKVEAEKSYIIDGNKLVPTWKVNMKLKNNWFNSHVKADGSVVAALNDWTADASYRVIKLGDSDPDINQFTLVTDPERKDTSPNGWHDDGTTKFTKTQGNNVYAQENWEGGGEYLKNYRPDGGPSLNFDFPFDPKVEPKDVIDAAVTNLFYLNNVLHDLFYSYGFTEVAGNFQQNNWGKGGKGNDFVIAQAQDGAGSDNAQFSTPPDGQSGEMNMFLFTSTEPNRDGDFENDIVTHEFGHGVSNRMTGGSANGDCLNTVESGGMGEGWSDFFGYVVQMKESDDSSKEVILGKYAFGEGIRTYPYSTNLKTNPTTYNYLSKWNEVHQVGEVWANILFQVYWNLMDATKKYNSDWYSADKTAGNTLALKIVVDGLALQPCEPTFLTARDAILTAEKALTGGTYQCAVWKAFSKRGLGPQATRKSNKITEDFNFPTSCN